MQRISDKINVEQSPRITSTMLEGGRGKQVNSRLDVRPKSYRRRVKKAQRIYLAGNEEKAATDICSDTETVSTKCRRVEDLEKPTPCTSSGCDRESIDLKDSQDQNVMMETKSDENIGTVENSMEDEGDTTIDSEGLTGNCDGTLVERELDELGVAIESESSESEVDNDDDFDEAELLSQPISPGHKLTLKTSILIIWIYAIAHCLTSSQLGDLLTLINLHLMVSHPVFNSVYNFKKALNKDFSKSGLKKHFYCSECSQMCNEMDNVCSNELCGKSLSKNNRAHFIELDVISQLKNLFKRDDFLEGIKYPSKRQKKTRGNIEDVYDGKHYRNLFSESDPSVTNVSFVFNTDGVPIFKSSNTSVWPIFLMINELPYKMRTNREFMLLAGLWCGTTKPLMNLFLSPMMESLNILQNGVQCQSQHVRGFLHCMSCDLPAMSAVLNTMSHTGEFSCIKCYQSGCNHRTSKGGNVRIFPYKQQNPAGPERKHEDILLDAELAVNETKHVNGIKGPSILMFCPKFDCVKSVAKDYMHLINLGLNRMLMKLWFNSENSQEAYSVHKDVKVVDDRLSKLKVPHFITRTPRTISEHLKFWKASEHRSWFFYYSIPCLQGILQIQYLYHYYALVQGIFLLNQSSISSEDIENAERLLQYFVFMLPTLYSEKCMTLNAHSLLHLPQLVKELGPLWSYSCFAFEGANGELLKMFHGTQFIDLQIVNAVNIYQLLPTLGNDVSSGDVAYRFVKSFTNDKGFRHEDKIITLGKPFKKQLDLFTDVLVREFIRCEDVDTNVLFYKRLKINGLVFHSKAYTRVQRRNSYSVKFNLKGDTCYGFVLWYGGYNENTTVKLFACIELLEPGEMNIFSEGNNSDNELVSNNFMEIDTTQFQYLKSAARNCIVAASDIIEMCVCVDIDNKVYFSVEPNKYEKNL